MRFVLFVLIACFALRDAAQASEESRYTSRNFLVTYKDNSLCLLGVAHISYQPPNVPAELMECYENFGTLGVEAKTENVLPNFYKLMYVPNLEKGEKPLKTAPKKLLHSLDSVLRAENVDLETRNILLSLHPMATFRFLSSRLLADAKNSSLVFPGLDYVSIKMAERFNAEIVEIEPIEKLSLIDRLTPYGASIEKIEALIGLTQNLTRLSDVKKSGTKILNVAAYANLKEICPLIEENYRIAYEVPAEYLKGDFEARNTGMVSAIENILKTRKKSIVVVGIGHFCGSKGILDLLFKNGYSIRQL